MKSKATNSFSTLDKLEVTHNYGIDLDSATVFMAGEIDGAYTIALRMKIAMLKTYWKESLQTPLKEVNFFCNSVGGDATIILSIVDYYEELKSEGILVNVHFEGNCMSAATFVCCGATGRRTAGKRCRFMVHEIQVEPPSGTATQAKSFAAETAFLQKEMIKLYAQLTQKDRNSKPTPKELKVWQDLSTKETFLSAEEAKKIGLIDAIA